MNISKTVYVQDFAGADDAIRIRSAIQYALETNAEIIVFEPVRYILKSSVMTPTDGFTHDDASPDENGKECHIPIKGARNLTLQGALDENGEPATVFVGYNDLQVHSYLPAILWCEDCERLTINDIAFTREPEYASAGVVIYKDDQLIKVEVFEGNPCYDQMGTYCMNRIHPITRDLTGESVTYGDGAGESWRLIGPRQLSLASSIVASKVQVGEHLSWHQGARTDFQTYFARCDVLRLTNLRTLNSNGFCMLTECCKGITAERVVFRPNGNRLFTAPRDAWKIFKCSGKIEVSQMIVEGVRMDGQNMHSNWLVIKQILNSREALFFCNNTFAPLMIGGIIELHNGEEVYPLHVAQWSHEGKVPRGHCYRIVFDQELPETAREGMLGAASCWEPDRYVCKDSEFINIAGAGHLVRYDHLLILNCKYKNTMNPGILLGAELPVHSEGGHATDIVIKGCEFDNCGFFPRYKVYGCIGIKSSGFNGKFNRDIMIYDNIMRNSLVGIHAIDAQDVYVIGNTFQGIETPLLKDDTIVGTIIEHRNQIV